MKVTRHAKDRGHDRMGMDAKAFSKLAGKALESGLRHAELNGQLKGYVTRLYLKHGNANNIRIYGHFVYLFCGTTLVTVIPLPNDFKPVVEKLKNRKHCE